MAWTVPRTWVAGELVTAALGNTHWRDNLALLKTSISDDGLQWSGRLVYSATVTTSTPVLDVAQTWNAGAVTFTALKLNVTDTASAAASLLADLQVGGSSKFKVNKAGDVIIPSGAKLYPDGGGDSYITEVAANQIAVYVAGVQSARFLSGGPEASNYLLAGWDFAKYVSGVTFRLGGVTAGQYSGIDFYGAGNLAGSIDSNGLGVGVAASASYKLYSKSTLANINSGAFESTHATDPYGLFLYFSGGAPNDTTRYFIHAADTGGARFRVMSNGGVYNYSANNVNLSDLGAKNIVGRAPSQRGKIRQIAMYRGRYKDSTRGHDDLMWGAQDILAIDPEWTDIWQHEERDEAGNITKPRLLGTRDHVIFMANVAVTAELIDQVDQLEARIAKLEAAA